VVGEVVYAFRVIRLPLLDAGGATIGRLDDIVVIPGHAGAAPRVLGFVAQSQRRRIFVNAARIAALDSDGARLRSWDLDLHPLKTRHGEMLLKRDVIDKKIGDETISDVALRSVTDGKATWWEVAHVRLSRGSALRRRPTFRLADWRQVPMLFSQPTEMAAEAARLRDMHPSDVAAVVRNLGLHQRRQLADAMDDERLADLLEELPEDEQLRLIEGIDPDRLLGVLDEMELDDLTDLLGEMPGEQRTTILEAMDDEDAAELRRLLSYEVATAGGMMTPEVVIMGPTATVADALAEIRDPEWLVSIACQVFVVQPPYKPPTGRYLGVVHFQRLLREPPSMELGRILEEEPTIHPDTPDDEVAVRIASYNLMSVAVCDAAGSLLGAITVDDVLDRVLPANWRQRHRAGSESSTQRSRG
jgi:CBS domain-containing protein